ncbi:hypothetical protein [[Pseudomonas] boreopolis]
MLQVAPDLIERSIAIIGSDGISAEEIETNVLALAKDPMLARRLIDWLPETFGIVFVPHLANVNLPTTFSAKSSRGKWMEFEFKVEPIFPIALRFSMEIFHSGPRSTFSNIALRSSMVAVVNRALNEGASLDGATLSGPALIGIPAETYLPAPTSLWRRLFR